jgi:hypothetical protein
MFEVLTGVPAPTGHKSLRKYKFIESWGVDQRVEGLSRNEKESVGVIARQRGQKVKSRAQEDGSFTVWRVK